MARGRARLVKSREGTQREGTQGQRGNERTKRDDIGKDSQEIRQVRAKEEREQMLHKDLHYSGHERGDSRDQSKDQPMNGQKVEQVDVGSRQTRSSDAPRSSDPVDKQWQQQFVQERERLNQTKRNNPQKGQDDRSKERDDRGDRSKDKGDRDDRSQDPRNEQNDRNTPKKDEQDSSKKQSDTDPVLQKDKAEVDKRNGQLEKRQEELEREKKALEEKAERKENKMAMAQAASGASGNLSGLTEGSKDAISDV